MGVVMAETLDITSAELSRLIPMSKLRVYGRVEVAGGAFHGLRQVPVEEYTTYVAYGAARFVAEKMKETADAHAAVNAMLHPVVVRVVMDNLTRPAVLRHIFNMD